MKDRDQAGIVPGWDGEQGGGMQPQPPAIAEPATATISPKARHPAIDARMDFMRAPMMGLHFPSLGARGFGPSAPPFAVPSWDVSSLVQFFHASPMRPCWPQKAGLRCSI
jgi:hypothetical protein